MPPRRNGTGKLSVRRQATVRVRTQRLVHRMRHDQPIKLSITVTPITAPRISARIVDHSGPYRIELNLNADSTAGTRRRRLAKTCSGCPTASRSADRCD
jgi:hypothetical protein